MVNELEKIKEIEAELIKVRLEITEKEQEKERVQKIADAASYGTAMFFGASLLTLLLENKLIMVLPLSLGMLFLIFWAIPQAGKVSKLIQEIDKRKKKTIRG